jgi:hypothetical protein
MNKITVDGVDHDFDSLTDQQKALVQHVADLDAKLGNAKFQLDQLQVARDAFMSMLTGSFKTE